MKVLIEVGADSRYSSNRAPAVKSELTPAHFSLLHLFSFALFAYFASLR
jgi:hypothetical protein